MELARGRGGKVHTGSQRAGTRQRVAGAQRLRALGVLSLAVATGTGLIVLLRTVLPAAGAGPAGMPTGSSPDWPHEPAGFRLIADQPFDVAPLPAGHEVPLGSAWKVAFNQRGLVTLIADSTAPYSPPGVVQFLYPKGYEGGEAPGTPWTSLGRVRRLYVGMWWKASDSWQGHQNASNKIQYVFTENAGSMFMVMYGPPGGPYDLRAFPQFATSSDVWLTPNVKNVPVTVGRWHRIEWLIAYDATEMPNGVCRWWLDGELIGDYTTVRYPAEGLSYYKLAPVWGGGVDRKLAQDYFRYDHVRLSGR